MGDEGKQILLRKPCSLPSYLPMLGNREYLEDKI